MIQLDCLFGVIISAELAVLVGCIKLFDMLGLQANDIFSGVLLIEQLVLWYVTAKPLHTIQI